MPPAAVLTALGVTDAGLSTRQANARLVDAGPNSIPTGTPASAWQVLLTQFRSVVTLLLMSALLIAALTGDGADAIAIAAVLILNVALGFAVEIRAHRAVEALADLEPRIAVVVRDGLTREIDAHVVVPGEVLLYDLTDDEEGPRAEAVSTRAA